MSSRLDSKTIQTPATSAFELNDTRGVRVQGTVLALALRPEKGQAMALAERLSLTPENGVIGAHGTSKRRQVSLLDVAAWQAACSEAGTTLPWTTRRSNILVQIEGTDLQSLVGRSIQLGTAHVEVLGEVTPCHFMDAAHDGLKDALASDWRGGVYARIIESGVVTPNDVISQIHSSQ